MTRIYLHSTDPQHAAKMKPEVYQKIKERRQVLKEILNDRLASESEITLEIGCGHGHFLTAYGQAFPNEPCIGIDVNRGRIYRALRKSERAKLKNVSFYECDSLEFLALLPAHIRIKKTWILYPDPWPKKRHFKNRIVQADFLEKLAAATIPVGQLYLRSDYEPFLEWSTELLEESSEWQLLDKFIWPELATTVFQELTKNKHYSLAAELKPTE